MLEFTVWERENTVEPWRYDDHASYARLQDWTLGPRHNVVAFNVAS